MKDEHKYIQDKPFYYQIGEVSTIIPWWRPNYDRLCKFLTQDEVIEIFNKYEDVEIIGNCLWDFDITWDMDLRLIISSNNFINWDSIEDDLNRLNYLALNEWRILPDIGVTPYRHSLPTKSEILSSEYDEERGEYKVNLSENSMYKISYTKKVVDDKMFENDMRTSSYYYTESMTERYLVAYYPKYHTKKITEKILNSKKEILENSISVDRFLSMGEEEFIKFQNY
jgi:hypothetical protein